MSNYKKVFFCPNASVDLPVVESDIMVEGPYSVSVLTIRLLPFAGTFVVVNIFNLSVFEKVICSIVDAVFAFLSVIRKGVDVEPEVGEVFILSIGMSNFVVVDVTLVGWVDVTFVVVI